MKHWVLILAIFMVTAADAAADAAVTPVEMHVFWGDGCPHCEDQKPFLRELELRYPGLRIHSLEIWQDRKHHQLFREMAHAHGIEPGSVPTVFLAGRVWVGDSPRIRRQIESVVADELAVDDVHEVSATGIGEIVLPFIGSIDLAVQPLAVATVLIALVDGLNPCSLWVLTLLLGLILHTGSRGRILLVGTTFLATTALIYGAFIAGVFGLLSYVLYYGWIQWLLALFAFSFGAVNVKDYFLFRQGLSFTIAERHKPGIYSSMRRLMDSSHSALTLVAATIVMASGIALVELPCTAGFPVIWSGLMAEQGIDGAAFLALLALYLLIYLLDELAIFTVAVVTLRMRRFEEVHGRVLKLVGGMIMLALGLVLVIRPALMNDIGGTLLVFMAAISAALLIMTLHRRWTLRPR